MPENDTIIGCFAKLGVSPVMAKVLDVLKDGEFHTFRDVERKGDLRQPEVSLSVAKLSTLIESKIEETKTKGRPLRIIRLPKENYVKYIQSLEQELDTTYVERKAVFKTLLQ